MADTAPFRSDLVQAPAGSHAIWVQADDGLRLRLGLFPADPGQPAQGTVLLFPGRTEYIEKYAGTAADLSARGFATVAIDWRGQGMADRLLDDPMPGHVAEFSDYQRDVRAMLAAVQAQGLPQPYFLLAHSMGGAIGLRALIEGLPVQAAAFSGPMWGIRIAPALRPLAVALGIVLTGLGQGHRFAPGTGRGSYALTEPFADNLLTTDPQMYQMLGDHIRGEPRFALGGPTTGWVLRALRDSKDLFRQPSPDLPCICFLGTNERIVDVDRIRNRMARWPRGTLVEVPGGEHEVLMEGPATRAQVTDQMVQLFRASA